MNEELKPCRLTQKFDGRRYVLSEAAKCDICNACDPAKRRWPDCCETCSLSIAIDRLAAYEDTGLTPEKIAELNRRAAQENDYAALKAQYDEINRYNISCTKKIDELLAEKLDTDAHLKAISDSLSEQLRRTVPENKALTCDGCEYKGKYEREYEYGYPSPCTACQRRTADNYARRPEDATSEG